MSDPFATPVRAYMSTPLVSVPADAQLDYVLHVLEHRNVSCVAVLGADGAPVGVVASTDLLKAGKFDKATARAPLTLLPTTLSAADVMKRDLVTVDEGDSIRAASQAMLEHHIHRVFVRKEGRIVGVLSTRDVMKVIKEERVATPLAEVMTTPVTTIDLGDSIDEALAKLDGSNVRGLVVLDGRWPVGVFTQTEAIHARSLPADLRHAAVEEVMSYEMLCLDVSTPLYRVAGQAIAMQVRRILAVEKRDLRGIVSGYDLARIATAPSAG
jgi:CBS domain-containing protein